MYPVFNGKHSCSDTMQVWEEDFIQCHLVNWRHSIDKKKVYLANASLCCSPRDRMPLQSARWSKPLLGLLPLEALPLSRRRPSLTCRSTLSKSLSLGKGFCAWLPLLCSAKECLMSPHLWEIEAKKVAQSMSSVLEDRERLLRAVENDWFILLNPSLLLYLVSFKSNSVLLAADIKQKIQSAEMHFI